MGRVALSTTSALLILLGIVAGSVGMVSAVVRSEFLDTDRFVATFSPLATDPAVQDVIISAVVDAVDDQAGFARVEPLVRSAIEQVVHSDTFPTDWDRALRLSHQQLLASLRGDPDAVVAIDGDTLTLRLDPIVAEVRQRLLDRAVRFAKAIPTVDRTITLATGTSADEVVRISKIIDLAGRWLPWIGPVLLAAGILLAARRRRTGMLAAAAVLAAMAVLAVALRLIRMSAAQRAPAPLTPAAVEAGFDAAAATLFDLIIAVAVAAAVVLVALWLTGRLHGRTSTVTTPPPSEEKAHTSV